MKTIINFANKVRSLVDGRMSNIANVEESPSTHAYTVGKQLIFNGLLCKATSAIAVGDTLAVGTNLALSDNVVEQIYSLNQGLTNSLNNEIATRAKLGGHNLFKVAAEMLTIQGVTFTRNSDGSFTVNGTASGNIYYNLTLSKFLKFEDLDYILTGCPSGGSEDSYSLFIRSNEADSSQWQYAIDYGNGISFLADSSREYVAFMYVKDGYTISNKTFYPMIRLATDESADYEPYSMTNRELTENYSKTTVRVISVKNTSGTWGDSIKNVLDAFRALTDIPDSDKVYIYDLQLSYMHLNVINAEYREFSSVRSNVKTYNCVGSNNNPKHILNAKIIDSGSSVELNRFSFEDSSLTNISSYTSQGSTSIHFLQLHNV